jgi:hypothetical protein
VKLEHLNVLEGYELSKFQLENRGIATRMPSSFTNNPSIKAELKEVPRFSH